MLEFATADRAWASAMQKTLDIGAPPQVSRAGDTREILGEQFAIKNFSCNFLQNSERALSPPYAVAELIWYLSRESHIAGLLPYCPSYKRFADKAGFAHGAYGERLANNAGAIDQLSQCVNLLRADPNTRRAVITFFDAKRDTALLAEKTFCPDIPCTLTWQFLIRDRALNMICTMRSEDIWFGLPYDIFINTTLQHMLANTLGVAVGLYIHQVGSLHLYTKHVARARKALSTGPASAFSITRNLDARLEEAPLLVDLEALLRDERITNYQSLTSHSIFQLLSVSCRQLILALAIHWFEVPINAHGSSFVQGVATYVNNRRSGFSRKDDASESPA